MASYDDRPAPFRRMMDRFWRALFLTPEGRPKSSKMLYTFCLSIVFMAVYGLCYWFLIDPLAEGLAAAPAAWRGILTAVLPGLAGSALCCSLWFLFRDKSYLPLTYIWLTVYAAAAFAAMLCALEPDALDLFLGFFAQLALPGLMTGNAFCWTMYARWRRRQPGRILRKETGEGYAEN